MLGEGRFLLSLIVTGPIATLLSFRRFWCVCNAGIARAERCGARGKVVRGSRAFPAEHQPLERRLSKDLVHAKVDEGQGPHGGIEPFGSSPGEGVRNELPARRRVFGGDAGDGVSAPFHGCYDVEKGGVFGRSWQAIASLMPSNRVDQAGLAELGSCLRDGSHRYSRESSYVLGAAHAAVGSEAQSDEHCVLGCRLHSAAPVFPGLLHNVDYVAAGMGAKRLGVKSVPFRGLGKGIFAQSCPP